MAVGVNKGWIPTSWSGSLWRHPLWHHKHIMMSRWWRTGIVSFIYTTIKNVISVFTWVWRHPRCDVTLINNIVVTLFTPESGYLRSILCINYKRHNVCSWPSRWKWCHNVFMVSQWVASQRVTSPSLWCQRYSYIFNSSKDMDLRYTFVNNGTGRYETVNNNCNHVIEWWPELVCKRSVRIAF